MTNHIPLRDRTALATALLVLLPLFAAPSGAAPLSITDGVATLTVDDVHGGMEDFVLAGVDHLWEANYYYRTAAMGLELPLVGPTTSAVTSVLATGATEITVLGATADFDFELVYALSSTGALISTLDLTNTTGGTLGLSLFNYQDWDVGGTWAGDSIGWNGTSVTQSEGGVQLTIAPFQTPDAVEASTYATLLTDLSDGDVDDLVDGSGLPFGPGDGTFALQFDLSLPDGDVATLAYAVPEPSTGALAMLGLAALARSGSHRARC